MHGSYNLIILMHLYLHPKLIEGFVIIPCTLQEIPILTSWDISFTKSQRYFLNTAILILLQIQIIFMKLLMPSYTMYMSYKTIVST